MLRTTSFFIASMMALSLFGCADEKVDSTSSPSDQVETAPFEASADISQSSGNENSYDNVVLPSLEELVIEPPLWSEPTGEAIPVSDVLIVNSEDIKNFTINILGKGYEKELVLEGEAAKNAASALLHSKIYNLNVGVSKARRGDSYLFTMESSDGNILTFYDNSFVDIKGHDMPYLRLDELRIPVPSDSEWSSYELDITTGLRKDENSEENPYLDYLAGNLDPADYCTVSMEEGRIFVYLCGNINKYNEALRESVIEGCKNIGDAEIITLGADFSNLQEYYPMMKEIGRKIKELSLEDKLLVRLKNDRLQIFGNADDDLSVFLNWLSTYKGRNSLVVRLN